MGIAEQLRIRENIERKKRLLDQGWCFAHRRIPDGKDAKQDTTLSHSGRWLQGGRCRYCGWGQPDSLKTDITWFNGEKWYVIARIKSWVWAEPSVGILTSFVDDCTLTWYETGIPLTYDEYQHITDQDWERISDELTDRYGGFEE